MDIIEFKRHSFRNKEIKSTYSTCFLHSLKKKKKWFTDIYLTIREQLSEFIRKHKWAWHWYSIMYVFRTNLCSNLTYFVVALWLIVYSQTNIVFKFISLLRTLTVV